MIGKLDISFTVETRKCQGMKTIFGGKEPVEEEKELVKKVAKLQKL